MIECCGNTSPYLTEVFQMVFSSTVEKVTDISAGMHFRWHTINYDLIYLLITGERNMKQRNYFVYILPNPFLLKT